MTAFHLQVPVVVVPVTGDARDVVVECTGETTVADLARALLPDGDAPAPLFHARPGVWLAPQTPIGVISLRAGDTLVVGAHPVRPTDLGQASVAPTSVAPHAHHLLTPAAVPTGRVELAVIRGPGTGRRIEIGPGRHSVGRAVESALTIAGPGISRVHLYVDVSDDATVSIAPATADTVVLVDRRRVLAPTRIDGTEVIRIGGHALAIRAVRTPRSDDGILAPADPGGRVSFNRPPRPRRPAVVDPIPVPAPPEPPTRHHIGWGASLAPAVIGVVAWLITGSALLLVFMALSPVIAIWSYVEDGRRGHRRFRADQRAFLARVDAASRRLTAARTAEQAARRAAHPDLVELATRARHAEPALWDRGADDPDFLALRIGSTDRPATARVVLADGGDPHLRAIASEQLEGLGPLADVPVALSLRDDGPIGISGDPADVAALTRALILQIVTHHSPTEVTLGATIAPDHAEAWHWLDWLPHAGPAEAAGDARIRALLALVDRRRAERQAFGSDRACDRPAVVEVLDGDRFTERADCNRLLVEGPSAGVFAIWLSATAADVPGACRTSVEVTRYGGELQSVWLKHDLGAVEGCRADEASVPFARQVATTLAPLRDVTDRRARGSVPRSVALADVLGATRPTAESITTAWADRSAALTAVIGSGVNGPVEVDLRHDGPHALVAGTTGSGKSELLRTLIVGLAATHAPARVNFLLVDYKGGAAFRECVELPHTVGLVTDLDHRLARRVLTALDAEVKRREVVLHDARAKDLIELERRRPEDAPASLVIVVDEFAALLRDVPEFVDGVVDIAQRGRSLGIHLVLATQRPNGVVSESVKANLNLRIALRVHDADDSRDVIGNVDAATIPRSLPGRAFLRTGPGEVVELQCAYAGGPVAAAAGHRAEIRVQPFPPAAREAHHAPLPDAPGAGPTELTDLVATIRAAARAAGAPDPVPPWLPPLPASLSLASLDATPDRLTDPARAVAFGLVDEPEHQRQVPFVVDFEASGALAVIGAGGSGATTTLRTLAAALAATDARIYGIDASGRGLDPIGALPQCGAVVAATDTDRVTALLVFLHREIERRAAEIAAAGVGTLGELRARPDAPDSPRVFLLLDGYGAFAAIYERIDLGDWMSMLHDIVTDGRSVGIHVVVTAERVHALPAVLAPAVPLRLLLRSADPDAALGLRLGDPSRLASLPAGRAVLPDGREVQIAVAGAAPDAESQRAALQALGASARERGADDAPDVPRLPCHIPVADLAEPGDHGTTFLAVADRTFTARGIDLTHHSFLIVGPRGSGRTTALATLAWALERGTEATETVVVRPRHGVDAALATLDAVLARVGAPAPRPEPTRIVVLIDDGELATEGPLADRIERLLTAGVTHPVRVVATVDPAGAARAFGGWVGDLRRARRALLLAPDLEVDGDLVGVRLRSRPGQTFPPGRGFLVDAGRAELVQIATPGPAPRL